MRGIGHPGNASQDRELLRKMGIPGKPGCNAKTAAGRRLLMTRKQRQERTRLHNTRRRR